MLLFFIFSEYLVLCFNKLVLISLLNILFSIAPCLRKNKRQLSKLQMKMPNFP